MNSDVKDLLRLFAKNEVRYLVIGGYAAMHYSQPRLTKDLDLWLDPAPENAFRVLKAFQEFGMPLIDVTPKDFEIHYLSKPHLIRAKEQAGRPQDLSDLDEIRRAEKNP